MMCLNYHSKIHTIDDEVSILPSHPTTVQAPVDVNDQDQSWEDDAACLESVLQYENQCISINDHNPITMNPTLASKDPVKEVWLSSAANAAQNVDSTEGQVPMMMSSGQGSIPDPPRLNLPPNQANLYKSMVLPSNDDSKSGLTFSSFVSRQQAGFASQFEASLEAENFGNGGGCNWIVLGGSNLFNKFSKHS